MLWLHSFFLWCRPNFLTPDWYIINCTKILLILHVQYSTYVIKSFIFLTFSLIMQVKRAINNVKVVCKNFVMFSLKLSIMAFFTLNYYPFTVILHFHHFNEQYPYLQKNINYSIVYIVFPSLDARYTKIKYTSLEDYERKRTKDKISW